MGLLCDYKYSYLEHVNYWEHFALKVTNLGSLAVVLTYWLQDECYRMQIQPGMHAIITNQAVDISVYSEDGYPDVTIYEVNLV
jgi:hypothetical protein